jgi:predicted DNA-binding ribbon-helix-helix protein
MSTLTIRLPDDKHLRLRELARRRSMSINKLMEELATISITEFDAETRFRSLAARGSAKKGLALLDKLDAAFAAKAK